MESDVVRYAQVVRETLALLEIETVTDDVSYHFNVFDQSHCRDQISNALGPNYPTNEQQVYRSRMAPPTRTLGQLHKTRFAYVLNPVQFDCAQRLCDVRCYPQNDLSLVIACTK